VPEYSSDEHRRLYWGGRDPCDFAHEREWRVPQDFSFQLADVAFLTVASYEDEAARPPDESAAILPRGGNLTSMTRR